VRIFGNSNPDEPEHLLLQQAASWPHHTALESLTSEALTQITEREGIDFATALLFDRFQKDAQHARFIERIHSLRKKCLPARSQGMDAKVVVIPGALYVERPDMGGDGRLVREIAETFGWKSDLIRLVSVGSVTENARRICDWLVQHAGEKIFLISLSKGSADLKMALTSPHAPDLFRNVVAWINVCGPLDGSRMANWILESRIRTRLMRLQYKLQGRDFRFVTDLRHGANSVLNFPLKLPPHLKMVSMVGFPLRQHLSTTFSRFCQRSLAKWGPNDGTILLSDLREWPGEIYPVWGTDHYFRPEDLARNLITAVFIYLAEELGAKQALSPETGMVTFS
jgi:hypothetical protein